MSRDGKDRGMRFCAPALKLRLCRIATAPVGVEEEIAIAAGDQTIRALQDRPDLVLERVVAPIAGRYRRIREQGVRDLTIGCAGLPTVVNAQIEDMPRPRLRRQRTVDWSSRTPVHGAPEIACSIESRLKNNIERQCDCNDVGVAVDNQAMRFCACAPDHISAALRAPDISASKVG